MKKHVLLALAVGCASVALAMPPQAADTQPASASADKMTHEIRVIFGAGDELAIDNLGFWKAFFNQRF